MKKIGFKNFRRFENFPTMELGDVTYLVGQNNAGKSTMVKAAILILDNLRNNDSSPFGYQAFFNFTSKAHDLHVDTFYRALRRGAKEKRIFLETSVADFDFEITVIPATDEEIYFGLQKETDRFAPIESMLVRDKVLGVTLKIYPFIGKYIIDIDPGKDEETLSKQTLLDSVNAKITELRERLAGIDNLSPKESSELNAMISDLEKKQKVLMKDVNAKDSIHEEIEHLTLMYSEDFTTQFNITREIEALAFNLNEYKTFAEERNVLSNFYLSENERKAHGQKFRRLKPYAQLIDKMATRLNWLLSHTDIMYIPAHLASQKIVMDSHIGDVFARVVDEYVQKTQVSDKSKTIYNFLKKWMDEDHFNIGKGFKIEEKLPGYYTLDIDTFENGPIPVGDMGMGTNQLMILLLHVANRIRQNRAMRSAVSMPGDASKLICSVVMIEEPEQNLHPKIQSLLSDLFYELATDDDKKIQFIIETHSEYIIRKTQLQVAKAQYKDDEDMENNPNKVYFFPSNGEPYEMKYRIYGAFSDEKDFESGFFDEASNIVFDIMSFSEN